MSRPTGSATGICSHSQADRDFSVDWLGRLVERCRACEQVQRAEVAQRQAERRQAQERRRVRDREQQRARRRQWTPAQRAQANERTRRWRQANPERAYQQAQEGKRRFLERHPNYMRDYQRKRQKKKQQRRERRRRRLLREQQRATMATRLSELDPAQAAAKDCRRCRAGAPLFRRERDGAYMHSAPPGVRWAKRCRAHAIWERAAQSLTMEPTL